MATNLRELLEVYMSNKYVKRGSISSTTPIGYMAWLDNFSSMGIVMCSMGMKKFFDVWEITLRMNYA